MAELVSIKRNVDVSPGQAAPAVFHCSQGDVGSKIILGLLNNGTAYSIPSGVTVTIEGSESNGSIFTPISATASGSDITFYLTGEMTAVAGPAICQAVLKSGSNILGTANFTLEVESSPMGADAPPVFTDAGWTWMLNKLNTEFVPALGNETIIDAIDGKADQSDLTALSNTVAGHTGSIAVLNNTVNTLNRDVTENRQNIALKLDKNQGTANAGKYLKVGTDGNVTAEDLDVTTDKTLSIADKAADAKAVGDELTGLKADLNNIADSNILFSLTSKVLTGTRYVYYDVFTLSSVDVSKKYTFHIDNATGTTASNLLYTRFYNSSNELISQSSTGANPPIDFTVTPPAGTASIVFRLYASGADALQGEAVFSGIKVYEGTSLVYTLNDSLKYQRLDDAEADIDRIETDFNDVICYNLMGADSSVYYPVKLSPGDKVTFSKKDGSVFSSSSTLLCVFCDINKSPRLNKALNTNTTEAAYTIPAGFDIRYLKWNEAPGDVMVNLGNKKPYVVYNADTIEAKINEIADIVEDSETQKNLINIENGFLEIGVMKNGDRPFTKDEVSPGDVVHYDFVSPSGATVGLIRLRDSANNNLDFYLNSEYGANTSIIGFVGRDAATRREEYKGSFIIPENFDHCFVQCNGTHTITVKELYVNKYENRILTEWMNIPRYYFIGNYLPAKIASINERLETSMAKGDAFIFITDLHLGSNQKKSPALIRYLYTNTCVNKLIYGGDLLNGGQASEYPIARKFMKEMREAFPRIQFFTVGNHDTFQNNLSSRITTWADTMEEQVVGDASHHYFYYDNPRAKIRYIVLNRWYEGDQNTSSGFYVDTVQRDWFANTALNLDEGWGALIFIHNLYNFNYTAANPVMAIDSGCKTYLADVCDAYNADANSKGEVIAIVQGHTHSDRVLRTDGGIPIIITTCDKNAQADPEQPDILFPDGVADRESGTIREQAFDVIVINRKKDANNKGTIYAIRVGCEAYDGTTVSDMGSATQERVILYDEKF